MFVEQLTLTSNKLWIVWKWKLRNFIMERHIFVDQWATSIWRIAPYSNDGNVHDVCSLHIDEEPRLYKEQKTPDKTAWRKGKKLKTEFDGRVSFTISSAKDYYHQTFFPQIIVNNLITYFPSKTVVLCRMLLKGATLTLLSLVVFAVISKATGSPWNEEQRWVSEKLDPARYDVATRPVKNITDVVEVTVEMTVFGISLVSFFGKSFKRLILKALCTIGKCTKQLLALITFNRELLKVCEERLPLK